MKSYESKFRQFIYRVYFPHHAMLDIPGSLPTFSASLPLFLYRFFAVLCSC
jgi:hypothetical protein